MYVSFVLPFVDREFWYCGFFPPLPFGMTVIPPPPRYLHGHCGSRNKFPLATLRDLVLAPLANVATASQDPHPSLFFPFPCTSRCFSLVFPSYMDVAIGFTGTKSD